MSNGIIVVKVPDKCCNCRMCFENEYYDQFECYFKPGTEIRVDEEKQEWCPIKPLPKKSDVTPLSNNSYLAGWNDCLDEIEGKQTDILLRSTKSKGGLTCRN